MRCAASVLVLLVVAIGCSDATTPATNPPPASDGGSAPSDAGGGADAGSTSKDAESPRPTSNLRLMAANISSGTSSTYDSGEGIRIFQALHPDIALVQELNYKSNSDADLQELVTTAFGAGYTYFRETGMQIPNGIVSRYPIASSGQWTDPQVDNRGFAYAKISIPGPHPLWAVSVHLLTTGSTQRNNEATALVAQLGNIVGSGDYVAIGGDFNTDKRTETCITTFAQVVDTKGPYPADQQGNDATNATRIHPYDWVLVDARLGALQVPTNIGDNQFASGLVFDSRVYTPLSEVAPVKQGDSDATNMQHMAVVKDFFVSP